MFLTPLVHSQTDYITSLITHQTHAITQEPSHADKHTNETLKLS